MTGEAIETSRRRRNLAGRFAGAWARRFADGLPKQTVETAEGMAQYVAVGSGPPVIFLHGLDGSSRWWTPTLRALAPHFRCYALEFVRFDRWRERARVALPRAGDFIAAWLAALGLERAHVIAHSMGGYAACQLAIERPELVDRLVLVAPALLGPRLSSPRELVRLGPFAWTVTPGFLPILVGDSLRTGPLRWLRAVGELVQADRLPLERITAPTLLIWGAADPLVPATDGLHVQGRIAGSRLLTLPGARHVPMYERRTDFNGALKRFLAGEEIGTP